MLQAIWNNMGFFAGFTLTIVCFLTARAAYRRNKRNTLREKLHASVGAYMSEEATVNPTSRTQYVMNDGEYALDANGKKIKAKYIDGGYQRIAKQSGLFQIGHDDDPEAPKDYYSDSNGDLILERRTTRTFERNVEDIRKNQFLDEMTDESWQAWFELIKGYTAGGGPTTAANANAWQELLMGIYEQGHNVIFKKDAKTFGEPSLLFVEGSGQGATIFAILMTSGGLKLPTKVGAKMNWTDVDLQQAIEAFK